MRLNVMAKYPTPGAVKTRLARVLGAEAACALYRAFLLDLAERLEALPYEVSWAYWPPTAPFHSLVRGARCRPQEGENLGERIARALAAEFLERNGPIIVIGADAPHLPEAILAEAAAALDAGADVVLGPAADGGYYLIGLGAPEPALFAGIPWSSAQVLATTRERGRALGLSVHLLPPTFDVDEPGDLVHLERLLARRQTHLPRTAAILAARRMPFGP